MNNKEKDLISIVIPCFNSGSTLERAINSARNQTWKNIEIIVVNDGSNEKLTLNKLDSLSNDIKLVNQINAGLPFARNKGFSEAKGKFILPLDADDWIDTFTLEIMHKALIQNPKTGYVFSDINLEGKFKKIIKKEFNYFEQLFFNKIPYCILLPKSVWEEVGGYNNLFLNGYEDWELNIRLGNLGYFGKRIPRPLFHYHVNEKGMLLSKSSKIHSEIWFQIVKNNRSIYSFKSICSIWKKWRKENSEYPLFIYFFWFFILILLPRKYSSHLFLKLRDLKWILTRN